MVHTKKDKGDIGVAATIAALTIQGWRVAMPLSEHTKYDIIAEMNGVCYRVQVRYTTPKGNILVVKLRSSWADRNGSHDVNRKQGDYDILAAYNPVNNAVYFLSDSAFSNVAGVTLRTDCKATKKSRLASEHLTCPVPGTSLLN